MSFFVLKNNVRITMERRRITMMSSLYETWTLKQEIPEPFAGIVQKHGGRRTSLKQEDCSRYNTGRAKSAVLHPPTLRAILSLIRLMDGRESGAAGHQDSNGEVNFYCLEYHKSDGKYALIYNRRDGKVKGLRWQDHEMKSLLPVSENGSHGRNIWRFLPI